MKESNLKVWVVVHEESGIVEYQATRQEARETKREMDLCLGTKAKIAKLKFDKFVR